MRKGIFSVFFASGFIFGFAQEKLDSTSIHQLNTLAYKVYLLKPDSAINLAKQSLTASIEGKYKYLEGDSYYVLSKAYWAKANYRLSTEYGFKALKIFENSSFKKKWGESILSLTRTFVDLHNLTQATVFINRANALAVQSNDSTLLADVYREYSKLLADQHRYDSALIYADRGITLYKKEKDTLSESVLYGRKAMIYLLLKDYKKSKAYTKKSLLLDKLVGNKRALGISYLQAAQNAYYLNETDSALFFLKKAIPIHHEIGNMSLLVRAHELVADVYLRMGKPILAASELKLASQFKDSLYSIEKSGQIQEMQSLYELESKQKTIQLLEQENQLEKQKAKNQQLFTIFLLVGIALLVLLILVLFRLRALQSKANATLSIKNKAIEQQKEEMQTQAESLHQLNQLKTKLFSVISHDLRGPLANLQALLELLTNNLMTADEFVAVSDKLKAHLNVTQRTLENLLNWSLSQMEGIRTEKKNLEVRTALIEAYRLLEDIARRKNISIENNAPDSIVVLADSNQVQLILRNLLHNAIKFSKPDSKIMLSASKENDLCRITIQDSGIGMTPEEINIINSSAESFTKKGTQQEKGTGLGLLLCKEFIKINGGTLQIKSKPGEGTEASFTLPLAS